MKRVLLDENLPRLLKRELPDFHVRTVAKVGWAGVKNDTLLRLAEAEFDVFVTADRSLPHQQTLSTLTLGVACRWEHQAGRPASALLRNRGSGGEGAAGAGPARSGGLTSR